MLFDSGAHLNVIGRDNDIGPRFVADRASALQVFVDDKADCAAQGKGDHPDHQQSRAIHSTPLKRA
jgi:hypothetical protein